MDDSKRNQRTGAHRLRAGVAMAACLILLAGMAPAQTVGLDPATLYPDDFVFTADIRLDPGGLSCQGVELVAAYDPFLLELTAITPGDWFTDAGPPHYFFDYTPTAAAGTIHFAAALLGATSDQPGILAVCHFTAATYGTSPLIFQHVDVRNGENAGVSVTPSTGDLIVIDPVISVEPGSFGTVKALFR